MEVGVYRCTSRGAVGHAKNLKLCIASYWTTLALLYSLVHVCRGLRSTAVNI